MKHDIEKIFFSVLELKMLNSLCVLDIISYIIKLFFCMYYASYITMENKTS